MNRRFWISFSVILLALITIVLLVWWLKPPSPGPIIVLQPTTSPGGNQAAWDLNASPATPGASCQMRFDVFQACENFILDYLDSAENPQTEDLARLTLRVNSGGKTHVLQITLDGNDFDWSLTGPNCPNGLELCYLDGTTSPQCQGDGLPPEIFGVFTWDAGLQSLSAPPPVKLVRSVMKVQGA